MQVINQVIIMALLIAVGVLLYKFKILEHNGIKALSGIVVYIASPASLFLAFQLEYDVNQFKRLGYAFILAALSYGLAIITATLLLRGKDKQKCAIERISVVLSNCGFMGIPLVKGIFSNEGVFFLAAFIAMNNIITWTYGVAVLSKDSSNSGFNIKSLFKIINSPTIYAIIAGVVFYALQIPVHDVPMQTIEFLAGMTTPSAMMAAGATIAQANFGKIIKDFAIYRIAFIKLILVPLVLYGIFLLLPLDTLIMRVHLTACACPTAAICTILAIKYDKDSICAAEIFAVVTVLSMITLPFIIQLPFR